jgi:hypothetical protein
MNDTRCDCIFANYRDAVTTDDAAVLMERNRPRSSAKRKTASVRVRGGAGDVPGPRTVGIYWRHEHSHKNRVIE